MSHQKHLRAWGEADHRTSPTARRTRCNAFSLKPLSSRIRTPLQINFDHRYARPPQHRATVGWLDRFRLRKCCRNSRFVPSRPYLPQAARTMRTRPIPSAATHAHPPPCTLNAGCIANSPISGDASPPPIPVLHPPRPQPSRRVRTLRLTISVHVLNVICYSTRQVIDPVRKNLGMDPLARKPCCTFKAGLEIWKLPKVERLLLSGARRPIFR